MKYTSGAHIRACKLRERAQRTRDTRCVKSKHSIADGDQHTITFLKFIRNTKYLYNFIHTFDVFTSNIL